MAADRAEVEFLPLTSGHAPGDTFAWTAAGAVSLAQWMADVHALSERLPPASYALNLCRSTYAFSVALAAALVRRQTSLLPASRAPEVLTRLSQRYADTVAIVDDPEPDLPFSVVVAACAGATAEPLDAIVAIPATHVAALVFTSGTTGEPEPHAKTWGSLVASARAERDALALRSLAGATILGTVPPQHMYGLESALLLAWQGGYSFHGQRPFYPADIAAALAATSAPRILVTTPLHLRALVDVDLDLPSMALIVSATAPLAIELARAAEARYGAPVREIYGCTETGQIASRRTLEGTAWKLMHGVRISTQGDTFLAYGGHVDRRVALSDDLHLIDERHFELLGRKADVVNIAGKRSSLAFLNQQLLNVPGVEDAVFLMPEEQAPNTTRLVAFVVAPTLDPASLLESLRSRVDPVFLPRPLYRVELLPRNATGKLPREALLALAARLDRKAQIRE
ncbi:MAG: AMP-binding protein [Casimicrobiaceae bacterium]